MIEITYSMICKKKKKTVSFCLDISGMVDCGALKLCELPIWNNNWHICASSTCRAQSHISSSLRPRIPQRWLLDHNRYLIDINDAVNCRTFLKFNFVFFFTLATHGSEFAELLKWATPINGLILCCCSFEIERWRSIVFQISASISFGFLQLLDLIFPLIDNSSLVNQGYALFEINKAVFKSWLQQHESK